MGGLPIYLFFAVDAASLLGFVPHAAFLWLSDHLAALGQPCQPCRVNWDRGLCRPEAGLKEKLQWAQACICAFSGAPRWHANQAACCEDTEASLGSLDDSLLHKIACAANLEFSSLYDDWLSESDESFTPSWLDHYSSEDWVSSSTDNDIEHGLQVGGAARQLAQLEIKSADSEDIVSEAGSAEQQYPEYIQ